MKKLIGCLLASLFSFSAANAVPYTWELVQDSVHYPTYSYDLIARDMSNGDSVRFFFNNECVYFPPTYISGSGRGNFTDGEILVKQSSPGFAMTGMAGTGGMEMYVMKYKNEKMTQKKLLFSYDPPQSGCVSSGGRIPTGTWCYTKGENILFASAISSFSSDNLPDSIFIGSEYSYQGSNVTYHSDSVTDHEIIVRLVCLKDTVYGAAEVERIKIDTPVVRTEQHLGADSLTVNFFLASGVKITRSYFIGNGATSVKPLSRITPSFQKFSGSIVIFDVMGRRIANTNRTVAGLNIVRLSNGMVKKETNLNRLR